MELDVRTRTLLVIRVRELRGKKVAECISPSLDVIGDVELNFTLWDAQLTAFEEVRQFGNVVLLNGEPYTRATQQ